MRDKLMTKLHHPVRKYRLPRMRPAHTIGAASRCTAPGAPTRRRSAAGRQTKATRVAARCTGRSSRSGPSPRSSAAARRGGRRRVTLR